MKVSKWTNKEVQKRNWINCTYWSECTNLSLHCFPIRPGKNFAISDHFFFPCFATSSIIRSSSWKLQIRKSESLRKLENKTFFLKERTNVSVVCTFLLQGPLTRSGFRTFCQRCRHWTSVLSGTHSAVKGYWIKITLWYILFLGERMNGTFGVLFQRLLTRKPLNQAKSYCILYYWQRNQTYYQKGIKNN